MRKNIAGLLIAVLFVPAVAMAQFHGTHQGSSNNNSSYQHPVSTGNNHTPGHTSNSGNGSSYNGNPGHNSTPSHNNGSNHSNNSNHGNNSGYGNGSNHGGNSGYGSDSNHGNNNGNSNNHNSGNGSSGYPGHIDNSGHGNPGYPGHDGPSAGKELMMAHYNIERAFQDAENSYYPYFMSEQDKRNMLFAMRRIKFELEGLLRLVDRRHRDEVHQIFLMVERSIFTMVAENNVKEAHRMLKRTEDQYKRTAVEIFRR